MSNAKTLTVAAQNISNGQAVVFKQIAPRINVRAETFRILSEGSIDSTGARKRIQVIVHIGLNRVETLSYREDL